MPIQEQQQWKQILLQPEWTETITVTARDDTVSSLWLNVKEGMSHAFLHNPTTRYFIVGSVGKLRGCSHFHGLLYNKNRTVRRFNAGFKGCNAPYRTPIVNLEGWVNYILNQGLQGYQIENITNGEEQ